MRKIHLYLIFLLPSILGDPRSIVDLLVDQVYETLSMYYLYVL